MVAKYRNSLKMCKAEFALLESLDSLDSSLSSSNLGKSEGEAGLNL